MSKRATLLLFTIMFSIQTLPALAERQVIFPPTKKSIGTVMIHKSKDTEQIKMLGQTRGRVFVPDGFDLYLATTPEGMQDFDELSKLGPGALQHLRLHDVPISASNLKTVSKMTGLTRLDMSYSDIDDSAIQYIVPLSNLKQLNLSSTHVQGKTLGKLKPLHSLESLDLAHAPIRDLAVTTVADCFPNLDWLSLSETLITDSAIPQLTKLKRLRKLKLSNTSVSDKYIDKLLSLKNLRKLSVSNTKVTPSKLNEMRKLRPDCKFVSEAKND